MPDTLLGFIFCWKEPIWSGLGLRMTMSKCVGGPRHPEVKDAEKLWDHLTSRCGGHQTHHGAVSEETGRLSLWQQPPRDVTCATWAALPRKENKLNYLHFISLSKFVLLYFQKPVLCRFIVVLYSDRTRTVIIIWRSTLLGFHNWPQKIRNKHMSGQIYPLLKNEIISLILSRGSTFFIPKYCPFL